MLGRWPIAVRVAVIGILVRCINLVDPFHHIVGNAVGISIGILFDFLVLERLFDWIWKVIVESFSKLSLTFSKEGR
jgi:hypothetical protein